MGRALTSKYMCSKRHAIILLARDNGGDRPCRLWDERPATRTPDLSIPLPSFPTAIGARARPDAKMPEPILAVRLQCHGKEKPIRLDKVPIASVRDGKLGSSSVSQIFFSACLPFALIVIGAARVDGVLQLRGTWDGV
jgi:hypothetical protein